MIDEKLFRQKFCFFHIFVTEFLSKDFSEKLLRDENSVLSFDESSVLDESSALQKPLTFLDESSV